MERWGQDSRKEAVITDIDVIVPKDHLLRKIENVMDYEWIYQRMKPYYCHDNGRPGTDPVVLIKMVLIQHRPGLRNVRRGVGRRLQDTLERPQKKPCKRQTLTA